MQMRLICNRQELEKIKGVCSALGVDVRLYDDRYNKNNKRLYINLDDDLSSLLLDKLTNYLKGDLNND